MFAYLPILPSFVLMLFALFFLVAKSMNLLSDFRLCCFGSNTEKREEDYDSNFEERVRVNEEGAQQCNKMFYFYFVAQ